MSNEIATFYKENLDLIGNYLAQHANSDFLTSVQMILTSDPKWKEVIADQRGRIQLIGALKTAASVGLSLNPTLGKAAIIPYKGQHGWIVNFQAMKNGLIEKALQSGSVKYLTSGVVKENDEFTLTNSPEGASYSHTPNRKDRGQTDGYFAALKFKTGECYALYITRSEAREHAAKYSMMAKFDEKGNFVTKEKSAYADSEDGMHVKTVIKMLLRNIYVSDELSSAMAADDNFEEKELNDPPSKTESADDLADRLDEKSAPIETTATEGKTGLF